MSIIHPRMSGVDLMPHSSEGKSKIRIETDSSGYIKGVFFGENVLPVHEIDLHGDAREPLFTAEIKLHVLGVEATAVVGKVGIECPICEEVYEHICYAVPDEGDEDGS